MSGQNVIIDDEIINNNVVDDERQPLQFSYESLTPHHFNKCVFYSGYIMVLINMGLLIGILAYIAPIGSMTMEILKDSQITIDDLQSVMPEIKEGLEILHDFCRIPEFKEYCYPLEEMD